MKNLLIIDLGRQYGGAEKVIEHILSGIPQDKYKAYLMCIKHTSFYYKSESNGYNVITLPYNKIYFFTYFPICIYYIIKNRIDLIHCNGLTGLILGTICGRILGKRVITTVHSRSDMDRGSNRKARIISHLELLFLNANHKCVTVSNYLKNYFVRKGMYEDKLKTIYNNISTEKNKENISRPNIFYDSNKFTICSVGRLEEIKGYIYLVKAVKAALDAGENIKCIIAGEGNCRKQIEDYIFENSIQDSIKLVGFIDDVSDLISSCNLFIVPSLMESFGLVILEAMREGKCIIATNVGGIPEIIKDNVDGYLVECGCVEQLYKKISFCYMNRDKTMEIGLHAYEKYVNVWKDYDMVAEYIKTYEALF